MTEFNLIEKNTNISELDMVKLNWDFVINGRQYQVVRIKGYVHTIGGKWGENCMWAYPLDEEPSYENMIEFNCDTPVRWGLEFKTSNCIRNKWDETSVRNSDCTIITRNGEHFYTVGGSMEYSIPKAMTLLSEINEHPLELNERGFRENMIGRKIWFMDQKAVIERWCDDGCVIIVPDGQDEFKIPEHDKDDDFMSSFWEENRTSLKEDIFSKSIFWFRERKSDESNSRGQDICAKREEAVPSDGKG